MISWKHQGRNKIESKYVKSIELFLYPFQIQNLASADCDKCSYSHSQGCPHCCFYYSGPLSTKLLMQFLSNWDLRPSMEGSNELHHGFSFRFCVLFKAKEALSQNPQTAFCGPKPRQPSKPETVRKHLALQSCDITRAV